jgi:hypothetical protein
MYKDGTQNEIVSSDPSCRILIDNVFALEFFPQLVLVFVCCAAKIAWGLICSLSQRPGTAGGCKRVLPNLMRAGMQLSLVGASFPGLPSCARRLLARSSPHLHCTATLSWVHLFFSVYNGHGCAVVDLSALVHAYFLFVLFMNFNYVLFSVHRSDGVQSISNSCTYRSPERAWLLFVNSLCVSLM